MNEVLFMDGPLRGEVKIVDSPMFYCYKAPTNPMTLNLGPSKEISPPPRNEIAYRRVGEWFGVGLMASNELFFASGMAPILSEWLNNQVREWLLSGGPFVKEMK